MNVYQSRYYGEVKFNDVTMASEDDKWFDAFINVHNAQIKCHSLLLILRKYSILRPYKKSMLILTKLMLTKIIRQTIQQDFDRNGETENYIQHHLDELDS
jgi:hypothetical protein